MHKKERQFYHTVEDEIELDPEIVADMEKYIWWLNFYKMNIIIDSLVLILKPYNIQNN